MAHFLKVAKYDHLYRAINTALIEQIEERDVEHHKPGTTDDGHGYKQHIPYLDLHVHGGTSKHTITIAAGTAGATPVWVASLEEKGSDLSGLVRYDRTLTADGILADIVKIESGEDQDCDLCEAEPDPPELPKPPKFPLKERGQWTAGTDYVVWDVVTHPDDATRRLLCLQDHKTNSPLALGNREYWVPIPAASS